ncbi:MAG: GcrA family cell cycle regulator [Pseudomonadota bacterium]
MSWTDERVELLKRLWAEGLSASQIAGQLGGVTRNAVIGKVHRLGLSGRAKSTRPVAPRQKRSRPATRPSGKRPSAPTMGNVALKANPETEIAPEPAPLPSVVVPMSRRASIMELNERTCRWPIGDPGTEDFHYCGCPSEPGSPYCDYHAQIAYQPSAERRRASAR